jgi:large subunit ribosomal protein L29
MAEKGTTKMVEIRDKSDEELTSALDRAKDELFRFKLAKNTNQLENQMQIRNKRREVARIMTVLSARKQGIEQQKKAPAAKEQG